MLRYEWACALSTLMCKKYMDHIRALYYSSLIEVPQHNTAATRENGYHLKHKIRHQFYL